ncbi:MAG: hypothetical protein IJ484_00680, partial [Oscillospiraceae bacterium]|nr:hypothetical protein [Oscillospiraceae bacterium]
GEEAVKCVLDASTGKPPPCGAAVLFEQLNENASVQRMPYFFTLYDHFLLLQDPECGFSEQ